MKILILHYYMSTVDGVMTTMIDTYFNLKSYDKNVEIKFICPELFYMDYEDFHNSPSYSYCEYLDKTGIEAIPKKKIKIKKFGFKKYTNQITTFIPFMRYNRNFGDIELSNCVEMENWNFKADVIICSARLLYEIIKKSQIILECDKIIVLDTFDYAKYGKQLDVSIPTRNCTFLCNPANFGCTDYKQIEYYHKYSFKRLTSLKQTGNIKSDLIYRRSGKEKMKIDDFYFENQGKSIFEHAYLGKSVYYYTNGMGKKDGLYYYLKLFDIDGEKNHLPLSISKKDIEEKLFMKENDYLARL